MKTNAARIIFALIFAFLFQVALAAPGTPIGGIIVKGGKNPGGQMRVLATTNADGSFTIEFAEGGEYKLEFEGNSRKQIGERVKGGMQLDYTIRAKDKIPADSGQQASRVSRQTPFHKKIENSQIIFAVPQGGGVIRGTLQSLSQSETKNPAERAINEPGVSVKSPPPKGGIKR